ncbi:MAG: serine protease [Trueperaceae bacterium]|nr:serine protease [Trueperaceae bacterium]
MESQNPPVLEPKPRIRRLTWLLLALLALTAFSASYTQTRPRDLSAPEVVSPTGHMLDVFEQARPATLRIEGRLNNNATPVGVGTGFFISEDGLLLTAYHVVDTTEIRTPLDYIAVDVDENEYRLELLSFDAFLDLALLQADVSEPVSFLPLAQLDPDVGAEIVAIGNSRGDFLQGREGKVSRLGINSPEVRFANNTIELTAALQPGDSGGPVLNDEGQVIGVVSYISYRPDELDNQADSNATTGFVPPLLRGFTLPDFASYAVPVVDNNDVLEALLAGEVRDIPVIGFSVGFRTPLGLIDNYDPELVIRGFPNLGKRPGVIVGQVQPDGPGGLAGLNDMTIADNFVQAADVIVAIDDIETPSFPKLLEVLYQKGVGQTVEITVQRGNATLKLQLDLGAKRQVFN